MSHHHHHHHHHHNGNGNGKLTPNLDEKSTKMLNLTVLQRVDPFIEEILITSAHVTLYEFNGDATQWSRKDVEGSLFVVKRSVQPRFQFIVMNRRSTDNLVEDLLGDFEYEVQVPYLLYRNASQEVNGIWFYTARECEEIAAVFGRILNAYSRVATKPKVSSTKSEFEELEAVPTPAVIDGPLEPALSTNSNATDLPDDSSFLNFFTTAINVGGAPKSVISAQAYQSSAAVFSTSQSHSAAVPNLTAAQTQFSVTSPAPFMSIRHNDTNATMKRSTNLVKPSSFFGPPPSSSPLIVPPISSSMPIAPPLGAPESLRSPYGAPLLQPFPPPTPPPSLTPTSVPSPNYGSVINREKVQEALRTLVQDNQFIDMVYRALMHAHQ